MTSNALVTCQDLIGCRSRKIAELECDADIMAASLSSAAPIALTGGRPHLEDTPYHLR